MTAPRSPLSPQLLEAFGLYRTRHLLDILDRPRIFAFVDGIVADSPARVISSDPCGLVLEVDARLLPALTRSDGVLVESPLHGAAFRARVDEVDHRRAYVSLSKLETFGAYHERRHSGRAVPRVPLLVKVFGRGHEAIGRVVDLSTAALSADFERARFARVANAPVVRLEVWGEDDEHVALQDFVTTARIHRTDERDRGALAATRVVLELDAFPALERALGRYVARRQRAILTELGLADAETA